MAYKHWKIKDLPWSELKPDQVDASLLAIIKAAALVEFNSDTYADYLCKVFKGDEAVEAAIRNWAVEEIQHGQALADWAMAIDPSWSFEESMQRFRDGYTPEHFLDDSDVSARGSRAGEMVARCMVETGTSSYYTAIGNTVDEPVLQEICKKIAGDEFRHYKLFYDTMQKYLEKEKLGKFGRLKVAVGRIAESEDDELAYAYYAANADRDEEYDREKYSQLYLSKAYSFYQKPVVDRAVAMIFKACGFKPHTIGYKIASALAWRKFNQQSKEYKKKAA
ncbi:MAG: rubrerythrin family protein [Micavibrio sp.]|nr:rubrerythrin family protein [Micavibrio sp.]